MANDKKTAIYSRKSKFTGKGESIENQIEQCRQYLRYTFPEVDESDILVFEDEGYSGGNINRPQFTAMMDACRAKGIDMVVCYKLDRISRNTGDFIRIIDELTRLNISFASVRDRFDTTTPTGKAMMNMTAVFAQLERETIAERIRDNMMDLAKTGRWLGGQTPTGYKSEQIQKETIDGKIRKLFKLTPIPDEAKMVRIIFSKFLETNSLTQTETYMIQNHILTKNGRAFSRFSIKTILVNPVYAAADEATWAYFNDKEVLQYAGQTEFDGSHGVMAYNKTLQTSGKANETREMTEWIIAVGKHEPLISGEDWVRVQQCLARNKSKSYRRPRSHVALLSGLLCCGKCGDYMRPKLGTREIAEGETIYSYLCSTKEKSRMHNCDMKNPNGNTLDAAVCAEIKKLSEDSSTFIKQLDKAKKMIVTTGDAYQTELASLQTECDKIEKEIATLVSSLSKVEDTPAFDYITQKINALHERKGEATQRIEELQKLNEQTALSDLDFDIMKQALSSFGASFDTLTVEQKRSALRTFIRKVIWNGENVHIYFFGSPDDDLAFSADDFAAMDDAETQPLGGNSK